MYSDHLGSVDVITNAAGLIEQKLSFDAFGKRRQVFNLSNQPVALTLAAILKLTNRGFTGHLQVDHASIIHMGGRIYDAHIGRFLQADPFVQAPSNSQSHNRYSYVLNNPLSMIDPSGYFFKTLKKYWRVIAAVVVAVYAPYLLNTVWGLGLNTVTTGAITGFVSGAISTGTLKGALTGAFTGAMFGGLHQMNAGALKVAAHGMAGGIGSVLNGEKFGHGFAAAGFTQFASQTAGDKLFVDGATELGDRAKNAVVAAIGGTASTVSGGKFANGAITGAFSRLLNDDAAKRSYQAEMRTINSVKEMAKISDQKLSVEEMLNVLSPEQTILLGRALGISMLTGSSVTAVEMNKYMISTQFSYAAFNRSLGLAAEAGKGVHEFYADAALGRIMKVALPNNIYRAYEYKGNYDEMNDI